MRNSIFLPSDSINSDCNFVRKIYLRITHCECTRALYITMIDHMRGREVSEMIYEQRNVRSACSLNDFIYVNDNTNLPASRLSCSFFFLFISSFFTQFTTARAYNRGYGSAAFDSFAQVINEILRTFARRRETQTPKLLLLSGSAKRVILSACVIPVTT